MEKKFQNKQGKNKNKGFSLIEVLMAVVLLGLIAAPILQMFYSSYSMNQKSKKYLAAADLLNTVMEGISAQTWDDSKPVASGSAAISGLNTYYATLDDSKKNTVVYLFNQTSTETGLTIPTGVFEEKYVAVVNTRKKAVYKFKQVSYNDYKFNVAITADVTDVGSSKNYYTVPITVSICNTDGSIIQSADTSILNTRTKQ